MPIRRDRAGLGPARVARSRTVAVLKRPRFALTTIGLVALMAVLLASYLLFLRLLDVHPNPYAVGFMFGAVVTYIPTAMWFVVLTGDGSWS